MRSVVVIAVAIFTASFAHAGTFYLDLKTPLMPTREMTLERCEGREACTRFVSERLSARCSAGPDGWSIEANARAVALVYGMKSNRVAHELLHVADIRTSVANYVRVLESGRHPTAETCATAASAAAHQFSAAMNEFAQQSMTKRH